MCGVSSRMRSNLQVSLMTFAVNIKCCTWGCWRMFELGELGLPSGHTMRDSYRGMAKYNFLVRCTVLDMILTIKVSIKFPVETRYPFYMTEKLLKVKKTLTHTYRK